MPSTPFTEFIEQLPSADPREQEIQQLRRFLAERRSCYPAEHFADAEARLTELLSNY